MRYRAAWVLPVSSPPLPAGVVTVDRGRILGVGAGADGKVEDLGNVAILPGLVNAHAHLELSWMRGRVRPAASMARWAAALIAERRASMHDPAESTAAAIAEARAAGTSLVGDVANGLTSYEPLAASSLCAVIFHELIGFSTSDPERVVAGAAARIAELPQNDCVRLSIVPHAPYSVSPDLMQAIARHSAGRPMSVHLGESPEEVQFLRNGTGAWREILESLGAWNAAWKPPGCGPVKYLENLGLVTRNLVAVHGVQLTDDELETLARAGATIVTCPRSNRWTGAGDPPVERFFRSGVRVAVGTDSLASVGDLNLFTELALLRQLAPKVPPRAILYSGSSAGAEALGFGSELGTLEPGKRAQLIAVRIPANVADVEEYLLGGIQPSDVHWLDAE